MFPSAFCCPCWFQVKTFNFGIQLVEPLNFSQKLIWNQLFLGSKGSFFNKIPVTCDYFITLGFGPLCDIIYVSSFNFLWQSEESDRGVRVSKWSDESPKKSKNGGNPPKFANCGIISWSFVWNTLSIELYLLEILFISFSFPIRIYISKFFLK